MKKFGIRMAVTAVACSALSLGACWGEDTKQAANDAAEKTGEAASAAGEAIKKAASDAASKTTEVTVGASEKVTKAAEDAATATEDAATDAAEATADAAKEAADAVEKATDKAASSDTAASSEEAPTETQVAAAEEDTPAQAEAKRAKAAQDELAHHNQDVKFEDGRYRLEDGTPTYKVDDEGKVDWASWNGFRRYHDACHVCHGPNALGGSFAPSLADSLKTMSYEDFVAVVSSGRQVKRGGTDFVMPAFATNRDIMCYLDDIYAYTKGRAAYAASEGKTGIPPGRPRGREDKSDEARQYEKDCLGE